LEIHGESVSVGDEAGTKISEFKEPIPSDSV